MTETLTFRAGEDELAGLKETVRLYREIILRLEEENQRLREERA
jgi:hypothetical protein